MKHKGQTYKCSNCLEYSHIQPDHQSANKSPCPYCGGCSLNKVKTSSQDTQISSEMTSEDIYWRVRRYNGR